MKYRVPHIRRAISRIPLSKVLIPEVTLRYERRRQGFQLVLVDEVVWDFPYMFVEQDSPYYNDKMWQEHWDDTLLRKLYRYLHTYMDTPRAKLLDWDQEFAQLRDVLIAADRRVSKYALSALLFTTDSPIARKIIVFRVKGRHV